MTLAETITSAIVAMASLSLPVILGFLLYSTLHIRKDLNREIQSLRKDMNEDMQGFRQDMNQDMQSLRKDMHQDMQSLRKDMNEAMQSLRQDMHQDISRINARLGRIEGRLFGIDTPAAG